MNPDSGRFHEDIPVDSALGRQIQEAAAKQRMQVEEAIRSVDAVLARAEAPKQGPALPPDWPRFTVGEIYHLKGHKFRIREFLEDGMVLEMVRKGAQAK